MFFRWKRREKEYIYDTCEDCENEYEKWLGKPPTFTEKHANPSLTRGQKSPKGTVRPPVITVQQETPPGPICICCPECCHGR